MELADILSEEAVIVCSGIKSKSEVLKKLSDCAAHVTGQDATTIFEAVNEREMLGSTGLGNGIAIPHGKFVGLSGVTAVFARIGSHVDDPVRVPDHVEFVFHDEEGVSGGLQFIEGFQQRFGIGRVQSRRRLVQHVNDAEQI